MVDSSAYNEVVSRLLVTTDGHDSTSADVLVCRLPRPIHDHGVYLQLVELSLFLARHTESRGGVLLHGALAESDGVGVILAAPGGTGKTTASRRLRNPWRSLCDDNTLVARDSQGDYWAHPWPTWSRFLQGQPGGAWNVQDAVRLKGIFFLSQAMEDRAEPVGPGHAVTLLIECAEQASHMMARHLRQEEARSLRLERLDNVCSLARAIPAHVLHISRMGPFWREIEKTVGG